MSMKGKLKKIEKFLDTMSKDYPVETEAFMNFMQKTEGDPSLDMKTRELINIGISVSAQCEWCIAFHAKAALEAGATEDEIMSAGFMAVLMHGGPALMYMMHLADALEEFANGEV